MSGKIIQLSWITRDMVRAHRETIFVFGDNMVRSGLGGQAGAMRGEMNSVGIPTKWRPSMDDSDFFKDYPEDSVAYKLIYATIFGEFSKLEEFLKFGLDVVFPLDGLGTGLSELPKRAPKVARYLLFRTNELKLKFGTKDKIEQAL